MIIKLNKMKYLLVLTPFLLINLISAAQIKSSSESSYKRESVLKTIKDAISGKGSEFDIGSCESSEYYLTISFVPPLAGAKDTMFSFGMYPKGIGIDGRIVSTNTSNYVLFTSTDNALEEFYKILKKGFALKTKKDTYSASFTLGQGSGKANFSIFSLHLFGSTRLSIDLVREDMKGFTRLGEFSESDIERLFGRHRKK